MKINRATTVFLAAVISGAALFPQVTPSASAQDSSTQPTVAKKLGTIKTISGNAITLAVDSGGEVAVTVAANAKLARLNPGGKDTAPIQLSDLQAGDTIRVRGYASLDGKTLNGLEVIVMTKSAVTAAGDQIRQDWQKRGTGGIVDSVDTATGTVTISTPGIAGKKMTAIKTSANTVIHRYSPDSVKPEDAKTIMLQGIQVGDQLRARGNRNADGSEMTAEEIYTGVFLQIDATIKAIDASAGTLSVQDLQSKKTMQLKITTDSQLHKIPDEMAQRFAAMLKMAKGGAAPGGAPAGMNGAGNSSAGAGAAGAPANGQGKAAASSGAQNGAGAAGNGAPGNGRFGNGGGAGDFQRRLDQTPTVTLADLHKGDAISVLATQGTPAGGSTVIKMFSGVEPILQAAPSASQAMMLTPWSLGGGQGGEAGSQ